MVLSNLFATFCKSLQKFAKNCWLTIKWIIFGKTTKLLVWYSGYGRDLSPWQSEFEPLVSQLFFQKIIGLTLESELKLRHKARYLCICDVISHKGYPWVKPVTKNRIFPWIQFHVKKRSFSNNFTLKPRIALMRNDVTNS